jgi:phosphoesterase RecJ-like protein
MSEERQDTIGQVVAAVRANQRFVLSSHARPDGDAIGSQLAMAYALDALGKRVTLVNRDPVPSPLKPFPGTDRIIVAERADGEFDASIIMECSSLDRTGVAGLDRKVVINIDHHQGNTGTRRSGFTLRRCGEAQFSVSRVKGTPSSRRSTRARRT